MIIALVSLAILAAGGIGAYALIHGNSHASAAPIHHQQLADSTPTPTAASPAPSAEQQQLQQFLVVIRESASARTLVKAAVRQIGVCAMTPATGITQLQQAITDRQNALAALGRLQVSEIPGGQVMRTNLGDVLQLSIAADRDFTAWMQDPRTTRNCPASTAQDAHYAAGVQTSAQAMQAKQQFLSQWNGIASQSGLPTFSTLDI
jgi:flagellar basal body-associated protein FliL